MMCFFFYVIFAVNVHTQVHALARQLRHVSRDPLLHVAIELNPLVLLKDAMFYLRISWIMRQP